jgi:hypothetical protein
MEVFLLAFPLDTGARPLSIWAALRAHLGDRLGGRQDLLGVIPVSKRSVLQETRKKAFGFLLAYIAAEDSTSHQWQAAARLLSAELLLQVKYLDMSFREFELECAVTDGDRTLLQSLGRLRRRMEPCVIVQVGNLQRRQIACYKYLQNTRSRGYLCSNI